VLGLRATNTHGSSTGKLTYRNVAVYGGSITNDYLNSFDIEASSINIEEDKDVIFRAAKNVNGKP
jgi:hypothetical protein